MAKGMSPLIGTVLLIALVIVIAIAIFIFARGYIQKSAQKEDLRAEEALMCVRDVNFDIITACYFTPTILRVQVANNGLRDIRRINVRLYSTDDAFGLELAESVRQSDIETIDFTVTSSDIAKIEMLPTVRYKFRSITCANVVESFVSAIDPC